MAGPLFSRSNFFMQFSEENGYIIAFQPPLGNPGSATAFDKNSLIVSNLTLFHFKPWWNEICKEINTVNQWWSILWQSKDCHTLCSSKIQEHLYCKNPLHAIVSQQIRVPQTLEIRETQRKSENVVVDVRKWIFSTRTEWKRHASRQPS